MSSVTNDVSTAAGVLKEGGIAIVPTDTVYGIAASLDHPDAVQRIYELKQRPADRPIPVLVSSNNSVMRYARELSLAAETLIDRFWPGPLTIVVSATEAVPAACLAGGKTVGLRMPDHATLLALIEACGGALAVTSANRSGMPETTTASDALESLGTHVGIVLDGGQTPGNVPSTVVDTIGSSPRILRSGALPDNQIFSALAAER